MADKKKPKTGVPADAAEADAKNPEPKPKARTKDEAAKSTPPNKVEGKGKAESKAKPKGDAKPEAKAKEKADAKPKDEGKVKPDAKGKPKQAPKDKPAKAEPKAAPTRRRQPTEAAVVHAKARYVRCSARKARLVADNIRGQDVVKAKSLLQFSPRSAARDLAKLLDSAVANAENNHELVGDELRIKEIYVDEGPTIKRWRPRARGRATRIAKRTSHISIALTPKEEYL